MMIFRALVVGLLLGLTLLYVTSDDPAPRPPVEPTLEPSAVVNASVSRVQREQIALGALIGLHPGEEITRVECTPAYAIGCTTRPGEFAEVTVTGAEGERTVLLLMRP
jgi:hypothetical protein